MLTYLFAGLGGFASLALIFVWAKLVSTMKEAEGLKLEADACRVTMGALQEARTEHDAKLAAEVKVLADFNAELLKIARKDTSDEALKARLAALRAGN